MKAALLARLSPFIEQIDGELAKLQPRERMIVVIGAIAAVLALIYVALWRPVTHARSANADRLAQAREVALQLERASGVVSHSNPSAGGGGSLLSTVDEASKSGELGKPLTRLSPDGESQVRAWAEEVSFDALVRWMNLLQTRYGIRIDSVDVEQQPTAGVVNARLTLTRS
jgi:general secretion pathway protein M